MQIVVLTMAGLLAAAPAKSGPKFKSEDEKQFYAIGAILGKNLFPLNPSKQELEWIKRGLADAANGVQADLDMQKYSAQISELQNKRSAVRAEAEKKKSQAFLEKAAAEPGAQKFPSGLIYKELVAGKGPSPKDTDTVKVNYRGTFINGTEFDSSYKRNQPAEFPLKGVIPCWTEGLQKMKTGEKAKLVCPSSIAYGDRGNPSIPGGSTLIFEVELLEVKAGQPPIPPSPAPH